MVLSLTPIIKPLILNGKIWPFTIEWEWPALAGNVWHWLASAGIKSVIRLYKIYDVLVKACCLGSVRLSKSTRSHRPLGLAGQEKDQNHRRLPDGYGLFKQGKVHGQVPGKWADLQHPLQDQVPSGPGVVILDDEIHPYFILRTGLWPFKSAWSWFTHHIPVIRPSGHHYIDMCSCEPIT